LLNKLVSRRKSKLKKVLVLAPHPDDEVLGAGGTIAKHTDQGDDVVVAVVSEGVSAQYEDPGMLHVRRDACREACEILGVKDIFFYDLPDARLAESGLVEITKVLNQAITALKPDTIYSPDFSELHMDHRMVYEASLVVTRSYLPSFQGGTLLFYETSHMKHAPFCPTYFVDISAQIDRKIKAFEVYESEVEEFPHPRSVEAIKTLARMRAVESGTQYAEGFTLGRMVR
jgi:LmbE family N-acetylglucosaminyl deacetylase